MDRDLGTAGTVKDVPPAAAANARWPSRKNSREFHVGGLSSTVTLRQ